MNVIEHEGSAWRWVNVFLQTDLKVLKRKIAEAHQSSGEENLLQVLLPYAAAFLVLYPDKSKFEFEQREKLAQFKERFSGLGKSAIHEARKISALPNFSSSSFCFNEDTISKSMSMFKTSP